MLSVFVHTYEPFVHEMNKYYKLLIKKRRGGVMNSLEQENRAFAGTPGVSSMGRPLGFIPAFRNETTGEILESRFANGSRAPIHVLAGLPTQWTTDTFSAHQTSHITSGFLLRGKFFTREEAAVYNLS